MEDVLEAPVTATVVVFSEDHAVTDTEDIRAGRFPYLPAVVACLAIGALTLLVLPTDLAYDPWSWLIWGRQLDRLTLVTAGSASAFKPLAAFIAAVIGPAGHAAPELWMVVVRGATALSMALAFSIGRRLQGLAAGVIAALALLTIGNLSSYLALQGMAEPLEMCCCLAALDCGLSGRHRSGVAWLVAASMLELELTGPMLLYGLIFLVWPAKQRLRAATVLALLVVFVGFAWLLPDLMVGIGALKSEARAVGTPGANSPQLTRVPFFGTLEEIHTMLFWPLSLGWLAELVVGAIAYVRRRVLRPLFLPALIAALFVVGVAVLTQLHSTTGSSRFLVAASSVGVVAAVCLWVEGIGAVVGRPAGWSAGRFHVRGAGAAWVRGVTTAIQLVVLLGVLVLIGGGISRWRESVGFAVTAGQRGAVEQQRLPGAIAAAGGAATLLACGHIYTGSYDVPLVAWALDVPSRRVWHSPAHTPVGSVLSSPTEPVTILPPYEYRLLDTSRSVGAAWQVYSTCAT